MRSPKKISKDLGVLGSPPGAQSCQSQPGKLCKIKDLGLSDLGLLMISPQLTITDHPEMLKLTLGGQWSKNWNWVTFKLPTSGCIWWNWSVEHVVAEELLSHFQFKWTTANNILPAPRMTHTHTAGSRRVYPFAGQKYENFLLVLLIFEEVEKFSNIWDFDGFWWILETSWKHPNIPKSIKYMHPNIQIYAKT